jgi:aminoglycoside phosphotransferase (APT) family kinase protein
VHDHQEPSAFPVPPDVVDPARLAAWMDDQGLGTGPLTDVEAIAGGTQNVLLRFHRDGRAYVLRRPPAHKRANSDETMRREARVLAALDGSEVPHPGLIAGCGDVDVLGAAFYLMEPVDGFNPAPGLPEPHRSDHAVQHRLGLAMADAIAALGRVDPDAVGVGDLGRRAGWLERQVDRWRSHLASYAGLDGYAGPNIPGVEEVAVWLDAHRPSAWEPGLIHGDFHFANVLVRHDGPELAAVVDWELCTIGDPLLDLGHLLATWPEPGGGGAAPMLEAPGLPTPAEVVDRYAQGTTRDLAAVSWYQVLACYRLGIILEGTYARAASGHAPRAVGDQLHAITLGLFDQASRLIGA